MRLIILDEDGLHLADEALRIIMKLTLMLLLRPAVAAAAASAGADDDHDVNDDTGDAGCDGHYTMSVVIISGGGSLMQFGVQLGSQGTEQILVHDARLSPFSTSHFSVQVYSPPHALGMSSGSQDSLAWCFPLDK